VDSSLRLFGCVVGFAFGVLWLTEGLGAAILCLLLAALGYGAVFVAQRAKENPGAIRLPTRTPTREVEDLPFQAEELNHDLGHIYEPPDDASSPLAAEAEYGWPLEKAEPELVHTPSS
jgi:hypothetical protein